jgi:hypothetical protein
MDSALPDWLNYPQNGLIRRHILTLGPTHADCSLRHAQVNAARDGSDQGTSRVLRQKAFTGM